MNKNLVFPALLALTFCLSACAPAAQESTGEAPVTATAETALTMETASADPIVPPVGHLVMNTDAREDDTGYYATGVRQDPATGEKRWVLYRLDYPGAEKKVLYDFGPYTSGLMVSDPFVQNGTVCCVADESLFTMSVDSGEIKLLPLEEYVASIFSDENAYYQLSGNLYTDSVCPTVQRVDLQTGEQTRWELPAMNLFAVYNCRDDRVLISRLITDRPIPSSTESDLLSVVVQNATVEYDWLDITTGDMQKILSCPYAGQTDENGQVTQWVYQGMGREALYFQRSVTDAQGNLVSNSLERCSLDGSNIETVMPLEERKTLYPVTQDGSLVWLMDYDYTGPATLYGVEEGKVYENIPVQGVDSGWPILLTRDGRVLVNDHYEDAQPVYAILDVEDYLAGSRNWTIFTDAKN